MRFVAAVVPRGPSPDLRRYLGQTRVPALPWTPRHHAYWHSPDDRVHIAAWSADAHPTVASSPSGFAVTAGTPRPARRDGPVGADGVEVIRRAATQPDWHPHHSLADAYALATFASDGTALIASDPLGFHPLYCARTADAEIIGNRIDLVAAAAACMGGPVARADPRSAAWLSFSQQIIGSGTGIEGVRTTPQHAIARIADGCVEWICDGPLWAKEIDPAAPAADPGDVAEELDAAIVAAVRHAISTQSRPPTLALTGGKDSRAVLACAHAAGLTDRLRVGTYGPADLPDVAVARQLCAALDIEFHDLTDEHFGPAAAVSTVDRFVRHVHRSSGTSYCGDANEPPTSDRPMISGVMGEMWRTAAHDIAATRVTNCEEATALFERRRRFNQAGLVSDVLDPDLRTEARASFASQATTVRAPHDLHQAYLLHMRWPRWFGPIVDLNDQTVRPFYDPRSIRSAFAMDLTPRTAEVVHRRLISKVEALDAAPFANDRWRADPASTPEPPVTGPVTVRHVAVDSAGPSPTQAAVQEIVHGSRVDHQLFSVAHRDVLIDAADRFDHLRGAERGQVLGAVTALLWDPTNAAGAT